MLLTGVNLNPLKGWGHSGLKSKNYESPEVVLFFSMTKIDVFLFPMEHLAFEVIMGALLYFDTMLKC